MRTNLKSSVTPALAGAALLVALAGPAAAAQLVVTSYDIPNGDSGTFTYWDESYDGAGSTNIDRAPLTGGVGDLTDGYAESATWSVAEGVDNGPYVGWNGYDPLLTFNLAGAAIVNSIRIAVDNSNFGGVSAPSAWVINGVSYTPTVTAFGAQTQWHEIAGLSLTGPIALSPTRTNIWAFASEVEFYGTSGAIPEPATWAMMIAGFGLAGVTLRRRRARWA